MADSDSSTPETGIGVSDRHFELVRILAAKLYRLRWADELPFEDYYQSGVVGLMEAAQRFQPGRGVKFSSFASPRITGAILNSLVHASEAQEQANARKRIMADRLAALAEQQMAGEADPFVRIAEAAIGLAIGFMLEDTGMYQGKEGSDHHDAYRSAALHQTSQRLRQTIKTLTQREREVVEQHYYAHRNFEEIAQSLGITKGRVSQLHTSAILRLRGILQNHSVHDFEA